MVQRPIARLTDAAWRHPLWTLGAIVAISVGAGLVALSLRPSVAQDTLISSSAPSYRATQAAASTFGGAPVIVLVREPLRQLLASRDLETISRLEACLAGRTLTSADGGAALVPAPGAAPYGGARSPCAYLMRNRSVRVVYGPGTFINQTVVGFRAELQQTRTADRRAVERLAHTAYALALARGLSPELARAAALAAAAVEAQRLAESLRRLALAAGLRGTPSITDSTFARALVFGAGVARHPRPRLAYLFPAPDAALIQARLRPGLTAAQTARTINAIRAATTMGAFRLTAPRPYTVTGEPVVLDELAGRVTGSARALLVGAAVAMALALLLLFGGPLTLLPLGIAFATVSLTFGAVAIVGAGLTVAALAALPILIGLAVDYAIQFQSRTREPADAEPRAAVNHAARRGAPAIAAAALATCAGFIALWTSPIPMARGFGAVIVGGIAIALVVTLSAVPAALALASSELGVVGASVRGAREILVGWLRQPPAGTRWPGRSPIVGAAPVCALATLAAKLTRHPAGVLSVAAALAIAGWAAETTIPVQTDITRLVGGSTGALRALATLERVSGVSGEIDVTFAGTDVATPRAIAWMAAYERRVLTRFGYRTGRTCSTAALCPAPSLPDLFVDRAGRLVAAAASSRSIDAALAALPRYFTQAVIAPDRRRAVIAFGVRLMPLAQQRRLVSYLRGALHPPAGVHAELAGLPVIAVDAGAALASPGRRLLTVLAAMVAVGLALALALRDLRRALVPLVPIALAGGWSSLVLAGVGVPLDPMSAMLGPLVIAIATEFSVLMSERYFQERASGRAPELALDAAYRRTGAAVFASGVTVVAGFGVLLLSDIGMVRDFGLVTVIDLTVSLAGVMLVLPAAIALGERPLAGRRGSKAIGLRRRRRARAAASRA